MDAIMSFFKSAPPPPPPPTAYEQLSALQPLYTQDGCGTSAYPFLAATLAFTLLVSAWERYLDWRQHCAVADRGDKVPAELEKLVAQIGDGGGVDKESSPAALLEKLRTKAPATKAYALDKSRFKFFSSAYGLARGLLFVYGGALPYMWDLADSYGASWFGGETFLDREIKTSLIFYGIWEIADTILSLPISIYSTFVIEARHGFNKTTPSLYVVDLVKTLLLTAFMGGPVLSLFLKLVIAVSPQKMAFVMSVFFLTVSFLFITIYPVLIQPMFNKYEPLEPGPLRTAIEALAASVDYPLYKLFTVDGSKRSGHSNAYMFGFFKSKRIVLFDTLLKQATTEEIVAILAHELGHWAHGHVLLTFCVSQTYLLIAFTFFARCMGSADLYASFGFRAAAGLSDTAGAPALVGVLLFFNFLWEPVDHMLSFAMTWNSRRMEYQADRYGADRGHGAGLQRGLVKITFENLGVLDPDPWFSTYHHSHPTLMERLRGIDAATKKTR